MSRRLTPSSPYNRREPAAFTDKFSRRLQTICLIGIFLLLVFYTLFFLRGFLLPVIFALLLGLIFNPSVRYLKRLGVPKILSSTLIILILLTGLGLTTYKLSEPALLWADRLPASIDKIERHMSRWRASLSRVEKAADRIRKLAEAGDKAQSQVLELKSPGLARTLFSGTQNLTSFLVIVGVLLFFLLTYGDVFRQHLLNIVHRRSGKRLFTLILQEIESNIFSYLLTVIAINSCTGIIVGLVMWALGMPNPVLWGVMAAFLRFIPYVGLIIGLIVFALVSVATFDSPLRIILPPACFWLIVAIEGNFVSPAIIGNRFLINPALIVIWLFFWGWMWGILGALLAVPMLAILKIISERIPAFTPLAEVLKR